MLSLKLMNAPNQMAKEPRNDKVQYAQGSIARKKKQIGAAMPDTTKIGKKTFIRKLAKGDQVAAVGLFSSSSKISFQG